MLRASREWVLNAGPSVLYGWLVAVGPWKSTSRLTCSVVASVGISDDVMKRIEDVGLELKISAVNA